jgi:hypothetical protein
VIASPPLFLFAGAPCAVGRDSDRLLDGSYLERADAALAEIVEELERDGRVGAAGGTRAARPFVLPGVIGSRVD